MISILQIIIVVIFISSLCSGQSVGFLTQFSNIICQKDLQQISFINNWQGEASRWKGGFQYYNKDYERKGRYGYCYYYGNVVLEQDNQTGGQLLGGGNFTKTDGDNLCNINLNFSFKGSLINQDLTFIYDNKTSLFGFSGQGSVVNNFIGINGLLQLPDYQNLSSQFNLTRIE